MQLTTVIPFKNMTSNSHQNLPFLYGICRQIKQSNPITSIEQPTDQPDRDTDKHTWTKTYHERPVVQIQSLLRLEFFDPLWNVRPAKKHPKQNDDTTLPFAQASTMSIPDAFASPFLLSGMPDLAPPLCHNFFIFVGQFLRLRWKVVDPLLVREAALFTSRRFVQSVALGTVEGVCEHTHSHSCTSMSC